MPENQIVAESQARPRDMCSLFGIGETDSHLMASFDQLIRVGHYVRISQLGSGGNGVVLHVQESQSGNRVAVKLSNVQRLKRELTQLIKLISRRPSHPSICYPLRACLLSDQPWISFPALACDLQQVLHSAKCPLAPVQVRDIAMQLAQALAFVHEAGIVHTDIKSENILLFCGDYRIHTRFEKRICTLSLTTVNLTDFGSAVSSGSTASAGTVGLLAPESLFGIPWKASCDMWGLGRLLIDISQHEDHLGHIRTSSAAELILAVQRLTQRKPTVKFINLARQQFAFLELQNGWLRLAPHLRDLAGYAEICNRVARVQQLSEETTYSSRIANRHLLSVTKSLLELDSTKRMTARKLLRAPYMTIDIPL